MKRITFFLLCLLSYVPPVSAQAVYTDTDVRLWHRAVDSLKKEQLNDPGLLIVAAGKRFMGTKYQAHTLDQHQQEQLVIHLEGQDCTTFLENTLALAQTMQQPQASFEQFTHNLQHIRYREGLLEGYPSRLHYFSDWLYENGQRGHIQLITEQIGGKPFVKELNFMSGHRSLYPALQNEDNYQAIQQTEAKISQRAYHYIPKAQISKSEKHIRSGDIIAITTAIKGLDIVHVGFAVIQNGRVHLLHASTDEKKVVISAKPLADYLAGNKNQSGIMVARVK